MKKLDCISGLVLLVFGVVLLFAARQLPFIGEFGPSSGFFPTLLSALLILVSLIIVLRAWFQGRRTKTSERTPRILGPNKKKYFLYLGLFFAFSLFFPQLGYTLSMVLFLGIVLKYGEKQSWETTFGVVLVSGVVSYFLFVKFLSIPLPEGILSSVIPR
jgi:putative tricarboxylic transport membrane protein